MDAEVSKGKLRVSWRRIGICLLAVFLGLYLLMPAVNHVMVWHFARSEVAKVKDVTPKALPDVSIDPLENGEALTAFGFSLRVPWKITHRTERKTLIVLKFEGGASIDIYDVRDDKMGPGILEDTTPEMAANFRKMYGSVALSSRYEFLRSELNTSPRDVSFWQSSLVNSGVMTKLMTKDSMVRKADALYAIRLGSMQGFQVGNANAATVFLTLFDAQDRELWVICHPPADRRMTQSQVNGIVASINSVD